MEENSPIKNAEELCTKLGRCMGQFILIERPFSLTGKIFLEMGLLYGRPKIIWCWEGEMQSLHLPTYDTYYSNYDLSSLEIPHWNKGGGEIFIAKHYFYLKSSLSAYADKEAIKRLTELYCYGE